MQGEYEFYRVNFAKLEFEAVNLDNSACAEVGVAIENNDTAPGSWFRFRQQPGAYTTIIPASTGSASKRYFRKSVNIRKQFGMSKILYGQDRMSSLTNSTPAYQCYFIIGTRNTDGISAINIEIAKMKITYYCQFWMRKEAPED